MPTRADPPYTAGDLLVDARARLPEMAEDLRGLEHEPAGVLADLVAYQVATAAREAVEEPGRPFAQKAIAFLDEVAALDPDRDVCLAIQTARRHLA